MDPVLGSYLFDDPDDAQTGLALDDLNADLELLEVQWSPSELDESERDEQYRREQTARSERLRAEWVSRHGEPSYPMAPCPTCGRLCGWLGDWETERQRELYRHEHRPVACFACLTSYPSHYKSGWWLDSWNVPGLRHFRGQRRAIDRERRRFDDPPIALWKRLLRPVWRTPYRQAQVANWSRFVDGWGPGIEAGFHVRGAEKVEIDAPDGSGRLVRFAVGHYRFERGRWRRLPFEREHSYGPVPDVFSAALPIEQLAEAWFDFQRQVSAEAAQDHAADERSLCETKERQVIAAQREQDLIDRDRAQRGVVDLF